MSTSFTSPSLGIVGVCSALGAGTTGCCLGPIVMQQSAKLQTLGLPWTWREQLYPHKTEAHAEVADPIPAIVELNQRLALNIEQCLNDRQKFVTLGGDHSCGIGTWSGARTACPGPIGLIWIDAHLDAHTPASSPSGNAHGMPLAALLNQSDPRLNNVYPKPPALHPQHLCIVGARDFEQAEYQRLQDLGVNIITISDVVNLGLDAALQAARDFVTLETVGYGISIDIDALDPQDAPGTGLPVAHGLNGQAVHHALRGWGLDPNFLGLEIAEFDPTQDRGQKTEHWIVDCLAHVFQPNVERL